MSFLNGIRGLLTAHSAPAGPDGLPGRIKNGAAQGCAESENHENLNENEVSQHDGETAQVTNS